MRHPNVIIRKMRGKWPKEKGFDLEKKEIQGRWNGLERVLGEWAKRDREGNLKRCRDGS